MSKKLVPYLILTMLSTPLLAEEMTEVTDDVEDKNAAVELPEIPERLSKRNSGKGNESKIVSMKSNTKQFVVPVTPGINQVLPISVGHINRIVTPFETPFVNTVSDATIEAHENVLYVATGSESPVTLFITPDVSDESMAISLTLSPMKIPPIEATLKLEDSESSSFSFKPKNKKAEKWEMEQPYVASIKGSFKKIALGEIPNGYSLGKVKRKSLKPTCLQPEFKFDFLNGQYLEGHNLIINVGTMTNTSGNVIEFDETTCIDGNIVAVSSWPHTVFKPGQKSEVYVMMRTDVLKELRNLRPSLLEDK